MLVSMTGFGRRELVENWCKVVVEARSVNNRYLDVFVRMPRKFNSIEDEIKDVVRAQFARGKIDIVVVIEGIKNVIEGITINTALARQYFNALETLKEEFNQPIELKPENFLLFEGIFERSLSEEQSRFLKKLVMKTLKVTLADLKKHRREEGKNLTIDCRMRLDRIAESVKMVRKRVKERRNKDFETLRNRILKVVQDIDKIDPRRVEMEVAIMAERFDVAEECVRLESHLKLFRNALKETGQVGRRLDFILQEINREANTISAKSNNFDIAEEVVRIKEEVEKLKEQIRNVE
ncbi:YicC/YloC family endoribonuclease [candidate division KSB1 bacterium]